jgi:hypothetical protein
MTVVALNRLLSLLILFVGAGAAAYPLLDSIGKDAEPVVPRALPTVTDAAVQEHPIVMDSRNIFDPEGRPWHSEPAAAQPAGPVVDNAPVQAIVKLRGVEGVITASGFIAVGEKIGGGTLKAIVPSGYVITTTAAGERTVAVDPAREQRLKALLGAESNTESKQ